MPSTDPFLSATTFLAALGCGLIAGVFYAFSTFVMRALRRLPTPQGIAAMQSINVAVLNPLFLGVFLGAAVLSAAAAILAVIRWHTATSAYTLAGAALYLAGTFGVTVARNVPLNNALAAAAPADPAAAATWAHYLTRWTAWNHLRTAAALAAMACFVLALRGRGS